MDLNVDVASVVALVTAVGALGGVGRWVAVTIGRDRARVDLLEANLATLQESLLDRSSQLSAALARLEEATRDLNAAKVEIELLKDQNRLLQAVIRKREHRLLSLGEEISDTFAD